MGKKSFKSFKKLILKYSQSTIKMITIKNKISIKIRLQTAFLTIQVDYHQQTVAQKIHQSIQNSITPSIRIRVMIHHQSRAETSAKVQVIRDISRIIKTSIQQTDKNIKRLGLLSNSDHKINKMINIFRKTRFIEI